MSHVSVYKARMKDLGRIERACQANGAEFRLLSQGEVVQQFGVNRVTGVAAVRLPGWKYDIAIQENGDISYDHWGSAYNTFDKLGKLVQDYNKIAIMDELGMADNVSSYWVEEKDGDLEIVVDYGN
jgi:hypothetical protein